jgi:adenosylmethionine-8-amino-7-oxononanoate aminotransferase
MQYHKNIKEARCQGTILALELKAEAESSYANDLRKKIYPFFLERNILLRPLGNVIYVLPPYVITNEQLNEVYDAIAEFLDTF